MHVLQQHSGCQSVQFDVMNFPSQKLQFMLGKLTDKPSKYPSEVGKRRALIL
jgi:hypothetical protein